MQGIKYNFTELKILFKEIYGLKILQDKVESVEEPIYCIDEDGYHVMATLKVVRRGGKPRRFAKSNPYTIKNINLWLKLNAKPIKLLAREFTSSETKMECECLIDGHVWKVHWGNIWSGKGCPKCRVRKATEKTRLSLDGIKNKLKTISPNIEILSKDYINNKIKLKCKCLIDGHEWEAKWDHLRDEHGCPRCFFDNIDTDGFFCITNAKRNKDDWVNKNCTLYVVELTSQKEIFYKIGITTRPVDERFKTIPYQYCLIKEYNFNLYRCIIIENELHKILKNHKYIPEKDFGGKTECFSQIDIENIDSIINNILIDNSSI